MDGELTLSIQQGLVETFWIIFNGLFTRLSRIIAGIYEINKFFSHDPGWHGHRSRFFETIQGGKKNMNELQYCLKSTRVSVCVPPFRSIKLYLSISPIFLHTRIVCFFSSFVYQPSPFLHGFSLPSTLVSHRLSFFPPQPRLFPFFFASFPAEREVGVFPLCPLSSPSS